ncbi:MAG TPA: hypothetical protein VF953_07460, partial [Terriglobales bacterium]
KSARLFTEPIGWLEKQFRAAGHDKDSRELAMHLFSAFQGMAAVAHGVNEPDLVLMEVRRLKNWINTLRDGNDGATGRAAVDEFKWTNGEET